MNIERERVALLQFLCVFVCWGGGGANLSGATLKKQSRGPVNLDEPDRACLAAPL